MNCPFCCIADGRLPAMKLYEDQNSVAFMDIAGDADGHLLVIPKKHCAGLLDCDGETLTHLMRTVKRVTFHLVNNCGFEGVNLLHASGESAGQSVPHFHIHIIPRKSGDGIDAWPHLPGSKQSIETVFQQIRLPVIGDTVTVTVDRPLGSYHPEYRDMYYPVNYGYVEGITAPDGEAQDAYLLGVDRPVEQFTGRIIAVVHRLDDEEEKWVVCPEGVHFSKEEIEEQIRFQEQYFQSEIRM